MSKIKLKLISISIFCVVVSTKAEVNRGYLIIKKVDEKNKPGTAVINMEIKNISPNGEEEVQEVVILAKVDDKKNNTGRALLRFLSPPDMKGTQVFQRKQSSFTEQYIFIPALSKWRSVPSKSDSFFGAELTYEDVLGRDLEDNTYELIEENNSIFKVKAIPKSKSSYDSFILTIDKKYNIVAVDFVKDGKLLKTFSVGKIENIDGFDTPLNATVENLKNGRKTLMKLSQVKYEVEIPEKYLDVKIR